MCVLCVCVCVIAVEFLSKHGWPALGRTSQPLTRAQVLGSVFFSKQHLNLFYQSTSAVKRKKGTVGLLSASPFLKPTGEQDGKQEEAALGSMVNQRD